MEAAMLPDCRRRSRGAYGGGQPRQSANDEAGDDELVHKVDDGGQNALDSPDQQFFIIEQINIKAVGESPNGIAGEFVEAGDPA